MKIYRVNLTEYEKGWGSKVFDALYFKKEENALYYIKENAIRPDEALMLTLTPAQKETLVLIGAEDEETNNI